MDWVKRSLIDEYFKNSMALYGLLEIVSLKLALLPNVLFLPFA